MGKVAKAIGHASMYGPKHNQPPGLAAVIKEFAQALRPDTGAVSLVGLWRVARRAHAAYLERKHADHLLRFLINTGTVLYDSRDDRLCLDLDAGEEVLRACEERRKPRPFRLGDRQAVHVRIDELKIKTARPERLPGLVPPPPAPPERRVLYLLPEEAAFWSGVVARFGLGPGGNPRVDLKAGADPRGFIERGILLPRGDAEFRRYAIADDPRSYRIIAISERKPLKVSKAVRDMMSDLQGSGFELPAAGNARPAFDSWILSRHRRLKPEAAYAKCVGFDSGGPTAGKNALGAIIADDPDGPWLIGVNGFEAYAFEVIAAPATPRAPRSPSRQPQQVEEKHAVSREAFLKRKLMASGANPELMRTEDVAARLRGLEERHRAAESQSAALAAEPETTRTKLMLDVLRKSLTELDAAILKAGSELRRRADRAA